MSNQCQEIITNAVTGEVTEVIRDWTPEELAAQKANQVKQPTVLDLKAQLADISAKLTVLENA